ncbi:MAG: aspartate aminotransferase family protein [Candidatus Omnitrophica bacterium]|nr:aspartate aminotransferase family protein [Candidatus Omnitrophota bacterium]
MIHIVGSDLTFAVPTARQTVITAANAAALLPNLTATQRSALIGKTVEQAIIAGLMPTMFQGIARENAQVAKSIFERTTILNANGTVYATAICVNSNTGAIYIYVTAFDNMIHIVGSDPTFAGTATAMLDKDATRIDVTIFDVKTGKIVGALKISLPSEEKAKEGWLSPAVDPKPIKPTGNDGSYVIYEPGTHQGIRYDSNNKAIEIGISDGGVDNGVFKVTGEIREQADGTIKIHNTGTWGWWKNWGQALAEKIDFSKGNTIVNCLWYAARPTIKLWHTTIDTVVKVVVDVVWNGCVGVFVELGSHIGEAAGALSTGDYGSAWRHLVCGVVNAVYGCIDVKDGKFVSSGTDNGLIKGLVTGVKDLLGGAVYLFTGTFDALLNTTKMTESVAIAFKYILAFALNMNEMLNTLVGKAAGWIEGVSIKMGVSSASADKIFAISVALLTALKGGILDMIPMAYGMPPLGRDIGKFNWSIVQDYQLLLNKTALSIKDGRASIIQIVALNTFYIYQKVLDVFGLTAALRVDESCISPAVIHLTTIAAVAVQVAIALLTMGVGTVMSITWTAVRTAISTFFRAIWTAVTSLFTKATAPMLRNMAGQAVGEITAMSAKQVLQMAVKNARIFAGVTMISYTASCLITSIFTDAGFYETFNGQQFLTTGLGGALKGAIFALVLVGVGAILAKIGRLQVATTSTLLGSGSASVSELSNIGYMVSLGRATTLIAPATTMGRLALRVGAAIGYIHNVGVVLRTFIITTFISAVNFIKDYLSGNIRNLGDAVKSILTGVVYGLFASYMLSPTGMSHLTRVTDNINKFNNAADTGALAKACLNGAVKWIMVSPAFTIFGAAWKSFIDAAVYVLTGGHFGSKHGLQVLAYVGQDGKEHYRPLSLYIVAKSAAEGPVQGLMLGPLVGIFSRVATAPLGSLRLALTQSQTLVAKIITLSVRATTKGPAWMQYAKELLARSVPQQIFKAGMITGFVLEMRSLLFVAGFVTGVSEALKLIGQEKLGDKEVGAGLSSAEQGFFGWAALFIKGAYTAEKSKVVDSITQRVYREAVGREVMGIILQVKVQNENRAPEERLTPEACLKEARQMVADRFGDSNIMATLALNLTWEREFNGNKNAPSFETILTECAKQLDQAARTAPKAGEEVPEIQLPKEVLDVIDKLGAPRAPEGGKSTETGSRLGNDLQECLQKQSTVAKQVKKLMHISNNYYSEEQGRLAKAIIDSAFPGKVFFANSGAEANEAAVKLARKYGSSTGRFEIITMTKSFHGRTIAMITATGQEKVKHGFEPLPAGFIHVPFNDIEAVKKALSEKTIGVMLEPIQCEGGVNIADKAYMRALRDLCNEKDLLLIFDEVQTGIARSGKMFCYQNYDITPDVMTLAKALGGGLPIGACVAGVKYQDVLTPGTHASTFGGSPIVCAAALGVFEAIKKDKLVKNARVMGDYIRRKFEILKAKYGFIKEIRSMALIIGVELNIKGEEIYKECMKEGLLINCTQDTILRIMPPITVTKKEVDKAILIFDKVFSKMQV